MMGGGGLPQKKVSLLKTQGRGILVHDQPLWQASEQKKKKHGAKGGYMNPTPPAYAPDFNNIVSSKNQSTYTLHSTLRKSLN